MFAIVESSGRQYQLEAGKFVDIDSTAINPGDEYVFERVLMLVNGKESTVGAPLVDGAKVVGKVLEHGRQKKIIVYHQKPKKGTRKKQGHRQGFTRVLVESIHLNEAVLAKAEARSKPNTEEIVPKSEEKALAPAKYEKVAPQKESAKPSATASQPTKSAKKTSEKAEVAPEKSKVSKKKSES